MRKCSICNKTSEETRIIKNQNIDYCRKHYLQIYRHGKTLDRTIYDKNEIKIYEEYAEIILYDTKGNIKTRALIDIEDVEKCKEIKWYHRKNGKQEYVYGTSLDGEKIILHRFILNTKINDIVDHINHNGLDNRKINLRICLHKENIRNQNKEKIIGVNYDKKRNKWVAQITKDYKNYFLGRFDTFEEAIIARIEAETRLFEQFSPQSHLLD